MTEITDKDKTQNLDKRVDYIRHVIIVVLTSVGAFWSVSTEETIFLPWAILIFFGAITYTLFLPYKKSTLITDDWKDVSRIKALAAVYLGVPLFLGPSFIIIVFPEYAESFPIFQSAVMSSEFDIVIQSISRVIIPFLVAGVIVSMFSNVLYHKTLRDSGYDIDEYRDVIRYGTDRSGLLNLGFMLMIVFAVLFLAAGWAHPSIDDYFLGALFMNIIIVFFGHFSVTLLPSHINQFHRIVLEFALIISLFCTIIARSLIVPASSFACLVIVVYSFLSKPYLASRKSPAEYIESKKREHLQNEKKREKQEIERDPLAYTFYRMHPYVYTGLALVFLLWFTLLLMELIIILNPVGLILGFIIPYVVYTMIPRIWLRYKDPRGKLERALKLTNKEPKSE